MTHLHRREILMLQNLRFSAEFYDVVPLPNENKPYDKIPTFSSKEQNRDLRIAPYYSKKIRSPESQFFVYVSVFFIQELYA